MRVDQKQVTSSQVKIHNVIILDGSGSMENKYINAIHGVKLDLETCKNERFKSYSFVEFNDHDRITTHNWLTPVDLVKLNFNGTLNGTPLYFTIGQTLERLLLEVPKEDKVLVKIFTDGQNTLNVGKYSNPKELQPLIVACEQRGFTITFIGTESDTLRIVKEVGINKSNTLVHNNTGEGVKTAFNIQAEATKGYTKRVANNENVTTEFYSKTIHND